MLDREQINKLREELVNELKNYNKKKHIKLNIPKLVLNMILFDNKLGDSRRDFAIPFELMKKLHFERVSFNNVPVSCLDFTGTRGVKIDPQGVYKKDLSGTVLCDTEITGPFDDVRVMATNFKGAKNAKVNPQKVFNRDLFHTVLSGVEISGPFDDVSIVSTNFTGSRGAIINPQTVRGKDLTNAVLKGVKITGFFTGATIVGANFEGALGAKVNPQTVRGRDLKNTNLGNAEIIGSFEKCNIDGTIHNKKLLIEKTEDRIYTDEYIEILNALQDSFLTSSNKK